MKKVLVVALCFASLPIACLQDDPTSVRGQSSAESARAWVATEPVQCLTNPWEADWVKKHPGEIYPRDASWPRQLTYAEIEIITDYYDRVDVTVFETSTVSRAPMVCVSCNCEEGYTLYLLVRESDVETMETLGYRREAPKSST